MNASGGPYTFAPTIMPSCLRVAIHHSFLILILILILIPCLCQYSISSSSQFPSPSSIVNSSLLLRPHPSQPTCSTAQHSQRMQGLLYVHDMDKVRGLGRSQRGTSPSGRPVRSGSYSAWLTGRNTSFSLHGAPDCAGMATATIVDHRNGISLSRLLQGSLIVEAWSCQSSSHARMS